MGKFDVLPTRWFFDLQLTLIEIDSIFECTSIESIVSKCCSDQLESLTTPIFSDKPAFLGVAYDPHILVNYLFQGGMSEI
jgi:hypothetical protein